MKKVASFCLYGRKVTYIVGMKQNIILGKKHFPDWEIRIYHNSTVPENYITEYKELGAICILCENIGENKLNWEGMFWRWLPWNDESVNIWISRDADSRLSEREAKITNEWITSGKTLHTIRDHKCHYNYIMGGMFGINNNLFRQKYKINSVTEIIKELSAPIKLCPLQGILDCIFKFLLEPFESQLLFILLNEPLPVLYIILLRLVVKYTFPLAVKSILELPVERS